MSIDELCAIISYNLKVMEIIIESPRETIIGLARKIGYRPMGVSDDEYNMVRPLSRNGYPRFHIYAKKNERGDFVFNLHLDQKSSSYHGSTAHSGEYEGDLVEREAERIQNIIRN